MKLNLLLKVRGDSNSNTTINHIKANKDELEDPVILNYADITAPPASYQVWIIKIIFQ